MDQEQGTRFKHDIDVFQKWVDSKHYQDRLDERLRVVTSCDQSKQSQQLTYDLCKDDPIFFIETFGWTYDPRPQHKPNNLPFILFDYQKETILWMVRKIQNGEDGLIEKSRDMGVTWLFVWVFFWFWRFSDSFSGLIGSYKESLVDNRTKDSMFGMLDYCLENMPKWLLPKRFKPKDHRQKLKLINPETFNLISGDTMNPDFSRGSRKNVVFMDEGATWEYFKEAWESAGDTTPCRLTCSTPKGRNQFAILRESGIDVNTIHWRKHPLKDEGWYEFQKERRTDEEVAQELDISYQRSQEGRVYPEWDKVEWGNFPYDPNMPLYVGWDFGATDDTAIIWFQDDLKGKIRIIDYYSNHGKTIAFYVPFITGVMPSEDYQYSKADAKVIEDHKGWKHAIHFGDPSGRFTQQVTNKSVIDVLKEFGIHVNFKEEAKDFQTRKTKTKLLLRQTVIDDNPRNKELSAAIENASYPKVRKGGGEEIRSIKPAHNWTSHARSALEYFAVNFDSLKARKHTVYDKFKPKQGTKIRVKKTLGY